MIPEKYQLPKSFLTEQIKGRDWPFDTPWIIAEFRRMTWRARARLIWLLIRV